MNELRDGRRVLFEVLDAERERHPSPGPVGVDEERKGRAGHVLEQERGTSGLHHPVSDGRDLEARVDAASDAHQLRALFERTNERAQAVPRHRCASDTSFKII
jgi:hypothetical protein